MKKTFKRKSKDKPLMGYGGFNFLEDPKELQAKQTIIGSGKLNPTIDPSRVQASAIDTGETATPQSSGITDLSPQINAGIKVFKDAASQTAGKISSGLDLVNGLIGTFQSAQQFRDEQAKLIRMRDLQSTESYGESELNNIPIYTKYGGGPKMAAGGGTEAVRNYQTYMNKKFGTQLPVTGKWDDNTQRAYENTGKVDYSANKQDILKTIQPAPTQLDPVTVKAKRSLPPTKPFTPPASLNTVVPSENTSVAPTKAWTPQVQLPPANLNTWLGTPLQGQAEPVTAAIPRRVAPSVNSIAQASTTQAPTRSKIPLIQAGAVDPYLKQALPRVDQAKLPALSAIQRIAGNPAIELEKRGYRAQYKADNNTMYLSRNQQEGDYLAEASHGVQAATDLVPWGSEPQRRINSLDQKHYDYVAYDTRGSVEYDAHSRIEPALRNGVDMMTGNDVAWGERIQDVLSNKDSKVYPMGFLKKKRASGGPGGSVEAEHGEIVQHSDGQVVALDGATHEQGGIDLSQVEKVLENTSATRKDSLSKALKIEGTSHAKLFEKEAKKLEKTQEKYTKAIATVEERTRPSNLATNAASLNSTFAQMLPSKTDIFDALFEHQEVVKQDLGYTYDDKGALVKRAAGGPGNPNLRPYKGAKTKKTPTGQTDEFKGDFDTYLDQWKGSLQEGNYTTPGLLQAGVYDNLMKTPEGQAQIKNMWKTYGNTDQGLQSGVGKGYNFNNLNTDQLGSLKGAYVDGILGARSLSPIDNGRVNYDVSPIQGKTTVQTPMTGLSPQINPERVQAVTQQGAEAEQTVASNNTPQEERVPGMKWYDLASSLAAFAASATRDPELYNPAEAHKIKLIQNDVRPYLAANQAEYSAARQGLAQGSIGNAQAAQLYSNKVNADNKALATVQQGNNEIINKQEIYNTGVDDKQSLMDQSTRESYYNKVLTARAKQQEQKLQAIDAFADAHAKHDSFYKTASLIQKIAPHFNLDANYNGKAETWNAMTQGLGSPATKDGKVPYRVKTKDGNTTTEWMNPEEYKVRVTDKSIQHITAPFTRKGK